MTISDRSLRRLRDFLNPSVKVKHRYTSLNSFHEVATDLELAEFYEENWEKILIFTFECYLLVISKIWVIESANHRNCSVFAFGQELIVDEGAESSEDPLIRHLRLACERLHPVNSEDRDKWAAALRREQNSAAAAAEFLKFPVVFARLLQLVPATRLLTSSVSGLLVALITRLLHAKNVPIFRVEGLKMLLTWLKTSSYSSGNGEHAADECVKLFNSLLSLEHLDMNRRCQQDDLDGDDLLSDYSTILLHGPPLLGVPGISASAPVDDEMAFRDNLAMFNEIFAFITWDMNPDLHSTRLLWTLLRDHYLYALFPEAYKSCSNSSFGQEKRISAYSIDTKIHPEVLEIFVDYLSLWLIKSAAGNNDRLSVLSSAALGRHSASASSSMLNLAVNDLSNLFAALGRAHSNTVIGDAYRSRQNIPVSSFLLEEIILGCREDVRFIHLILRSACTILPFSRCVFSIKLVLEILRSWAFNPPARRPLFLAGADDTVVDEFLEFYVDCLGALFPGKHIEGDDSENDYKVILADRLDIYREAVYFIRALALQAFVALTSKRWLQIIDLLLEITEYLLSPDNVLERPFLSNEDSLLCESILGCLMRAGLPSKEDTDLKVRWQEASRILMQCAGNYGLIEEWCRVIETLATLAVKDGRILQGSISRAVSSASSRVSSPIVSPATSMATLPPITASFAAWPDHPAIRSNSVALFRNMLRILGDPSTLYGIHKTPDLTTKIFESLERICNVFLKCRASQCVRVDVSAVPPVSDLLPAALAAVLNLKPTSDDGPDDIHVPTRTICWRILGRILFRPADIVVPEHYWAAMLLAARNVLSTSTMNAEEMASFIQYIGLPVSTASIPGCTLIMTDIVDALLRFFNDALWSGQVKFTAREAAALLPPTMKFCMNAWSLAAVNPATFGHFRDPACLLRLLKLLSRSLTDPDLLALLYATAAAAFVNDFTRESKDDELTEGLFEMILEGLRLDRGVKAALAVADYVSALAYFPSQLNGPYRERLLLALIEACQIALQTSEVVVVELVQGALSDWLLQHLHGRFPSDSCEQAFHSLVTAIDVNSEFWTKAPSACASILALSQRVLLYKQIFPGPVGASLLGSLPQQRKALLRLALPPASTLLSFEIDTTSTHGSGDIFVTSRNPFGCFTWKFHLPLASPANRSQAIEKPRKIAPTSVFSRKVLPDSEFPVPRPQRPADVEQAETETEIPKHDQSPRDVLRRLMNYLSQRYPDCEFKNNLLLLEEANSRLFKDQIAIEAEFVSKHAHRPLSSPQLKSSDTDRALESSDGKQVLVRRLLNSLGFSLQELYLSRGGGPGVMLLKEELSDELESLDLLAPRQEVKIGCVYVPEGCVEERGLLPVVDKKDTIDTRFVDFLDSLAARPGEEHFGFKGGLLPDEPVKFSYLGTPTIELVVHENVTCVEQEGDDSVVKFKRHLGNDSVLIIWHSSPDTFTERNCLQSEVTSAIIRILPHRVLPGLYHVTLQTCFERVAQPRKFARLRVDAFSVMAEGGFGSEESRLADLVNGPGGGAFSFDRIQGTTLLVPQAVLGAVMRALAIASAQKSYWLEGVRSSTVISSEHSKVPAVTLSQISAADRVKLAPETVRKKYIDSIISKYGQPELPYHLFLTKLF